MVFGFLVALLFLPILNPEHKILFVAIVSFASLIPDIDHEGSKINKLLPVTRWVGKFFKHRGFFHSIFPAVIIYGLGWWFGWGEFGIAMVIGYITHLASDALTRMGVNLLHPFSTLRIQGFIHTGGVWEWVTFGVVGALAVLKLVSILF